MREGSKPIEITGKYFGKLYVIGLDHKNDKSGSWWLCECECGNKIILRSRELIKGYKTSCGCDTGNGTNMVREYDSLYNVWCNIRQRCLNVKNPAYNRYGERNIYVCHEWNSFENFRDWALKNGYKYGLSIDRIDNNDGYYPENCRWADHTTQANNKSSNRFINYANETHTIAEWSRILGVNYATLLRHINNKNMIDFINYYKNDEKS